MRRVVAGLASIGILLSLQLSHTPIASACGSSSASSARTGGTPTPSPCPSPSPSSASTQSVLDQLRARLGGDLARALFTQQKLSNALDRTAASQQALTDQIAQEEAKAVAEIRVIAVDVPKLVAAATLFVAVGAVAGLVELLPWVVNWKSA